MSEYLGSLSGPVAMEEEERKESVVGSRAEVCVQGKWVSESRNPLTHRLHAFSRNLCSFLE